MTAIAVVCSVGLFAQQPAPQVPRPSFETKAEIVLVDVNVVDREAKPVPALTDADFELEVNGQPRKIESVQFISTTATETTPATPREAAYTSNETQTTGRLLLFVVDEGSLRAGANRSILRAAQSLFDRLAPGDLVGLARLPTGFGGVEFTADRTRVSDALMRVTGAASSRIGMNHINISEAWALENNDSGTFQNAVDRECNGMSGPELEACRNQIEGDARAMLLEASGRARATLQALEALLKNLVQLKMPVNIVLMSEGMFVARDRVSMTALGRVAAEARATIHVIRPSQQFFDVEDRAPGGGSSRFFDDGLMSEGLEQVAGQTRGSMSTVTGDGTIAFDRLGRELSGYYLLGFEPMESDRTGRERRIKVSVKPRGLTVRSRPTFVVPVAAAETTKATAAMTPMQQLGDVLKSPLPMRGLPMRVASYSSIESGGKVRVVITAEVGDPATTPAEWPIGVIVLDKNDKIVVNRGGIFTLQPASKGMESPRLLLTSVALDPGDYTLRVAAVDDTGRGGSVHHSIHARLNRGPSGLHVSDLMLVAQPPVAGELPRPRPTTVIDSEMVSAMIEMTGPDQGVLGRTKVTLQISDAENGNPLVNVEAKQAARGNVRAFAAQMRLGVLPPGEYVARAVIAPPGQPEMRLTRAFMLSPVADTSTPPPDLGVPLDPDAPPAPIAASKILAPVPRFSARTILTPEVVMPFLEGLSDMHPPTTPEVEAVIEKAKSGNYDAPADRGATADDELNLAFVRGLGALSKGEIAQAAAWFQQTLKGASDFLGAAFYLGATHAVSGRDKEAIGAWEMALLSENPGAVYPVLVDALLRTGDGREALDILEEAPSAWPNDNERLKREAIALAMLGDFSGALPKLKDQLDNTRNDDQPMLFVAIQVLYRLHQQDKSLSEDNLRRFRSYVERHQKLGGPDRAIVETWRRAVLGR
ncbi:MAG: VWA domain-containing protein [Cyanobacteria bacterium]|nr:VWA domain-containing protein [Cyanobacteriota bacterium]